MEANKDIHEVLEIAEDAFWEAVGKEYPQVKTGDFPFNEIFALGRAMESAIKIWVELNVPDESQNNK